MTVRMDKLPGIEPKKRAAKRKAVMRGTWRCEGVRGCGELLTGTYAAAERHADTHGGARLALVESARYAT